MIEIIESLELWNIWLTQNPTEKRFSFHQSHTYDDSEDLITFLISNKLQA